MDDRRFDALTRSVTRDWSRRGTLELLAGGVLGGLLTVFGAPRSEAAHFDCRHFGERCQGGTQGNAQCCSGICKRRRCRAHDRGICKVGQNACGTTEVKCGVNGTGSCFCFVTTGKAPFCGGDSVTFACTRDEQCVSVRGAGSACVLCNGQTVCMARCPAPR